MAVWDNVKTAVEMHMVMGMNLHFAVEVRGFPRQLGCRS